MLDEPAHCGHDKNLVGKRIHEFTEVCDLVVMTGDISVEQVGETCNDEDDQSPDVGAGESCVEHAEEYRHENDTKYCKFICGRHIIFPPTPFYFTSN